jgi:hypothetical protein
MPVRGTAMNSTDNQIQEVWRKGQIAGKLNPEKWRVDACGAWISREQFGNKGSMYGWVLGHVTPLDRGGSDDISNLRPLQWRNEMARKNGELTCPVRAYGGENIAVA